MILIILKIICSLEEDKKQRRNIAFVQLKVNEEEKNCATCIHIEFYQNLQKWISRNLMKQT